MSAFHHQIVFDLMYEFVLIVAVDLVRKAEPNKRRQLTLVIEKTMLSSSTFLLFFFLMYEWICWKTMKIVCDLEREGERERKKNKSK
jgi:hypothetical protein